MLINLYIEEVLWKGNHPLYRNRIAKQDALQRIAEKLNISCAATDIGALKPLFTSKDIEDKLKNLRSQYGRDKKG